MVPMASSTKPSDRYPTGVGGDILSRILAVDPGEVRLGIAISDPSGTIARPLETLYHQSRAADAEAILAIAHEHAAALILVGVAYDEGGQTGPQARKALRLAEAIQSIGTLPVETWDETGSTLVALRNKERDTNLDARAAAVILQDYLDVQNP